MLWWYVVEAKLTMGNKHQEDTSISRVQQQKGWNKMMGVAGNGSDEIVDVRVVSTTMTSELQTGW